MKIILNSDLYLRSLNMGDATAFYKLLVNNYDHFKENLIWMEQEQLHRQAQESMKLRIEMVSREKHFPLWFGIIYKGQLCGMIGFNELDEDNNIGEMGYFIASEFTSRGIMTSALEAIIDYSFTQLFLNKIELYINGNNLASCRLADKLHFKLEGVLRESQKIEEQYVNQRVYGLLHSEYASLN